MSSETSAETSCNFDEQVKPASAYYPVDTHNSLVASNKGRKTYESSFPKTSA
jgi:hypothetical protein